MDLILIIKAGIILLFLFAVLIYFVFFHRQLPEQKGIYYVIIITILSIVVIYSVTFLEYKIGGKTISIEKIKEAEERVLAKEKEIKKIKEEIEISKKQIIDTKEEILKMRENLLKTTNINLKIAAILADGAGRWGGFPDTHLRKIDEYSKELEKTIGLNYPKVKNEIADTLKILNKEIQEKSKNK